MTSVSSGRPVRRPGAVGGTATSWRDPGGVLPAGAAGGGGEKIHKVLAAAGVASRRRAEGLVLAGRVRVNGEAAVVGQRVDAARDRISVDGVPVGVAPERHHLLLYKPRGVISTASDPEGRPTVVDLVSAPARLFPVGRLDADSEGLMVLTDDGALAELLTHPRYGIEKTYVVLVDRQPTPGQLRALRVGVELDDGLARARRVAQVGPRAIRVVLAEGRNREVRRMLAAVGLDTERLVRTGIGPVADPSLSAGEWRALRPAEIRACWAAASRDRRKTAAWPAARPRSRRAE